MCAFAVLAPCAPVASAQSLLDREPPVTIGVLDGPSEYVFAWIGDLEVDARGNVYVLDLRTRRITRYAPDGTFLEQIGGPGQGPGEFREPNRFHIDGSGRLHVVDPGNNRLTIFDVTGDEARYVEDQRLGPSVPLVLGICGARDRRFVLTRTGPALIMEISADGRPLRGFGEPPRPTGQLARDLAGYEPPGELLRGGKIHCDAAAGRILYTTLRTGIVRMYDLEGDLLWSRTLADYHGPRIRAAGAGAPIPCCTMSANPETGTTEHLLSSVFQGDQVRLSIYEWSSDVDRYETRVLSAADGTELWREPSPVAVAEVRDGRIFGYRQAPFPQVMIW